MLNEASGVYRVAPDSLWWHNDSGDGPNLYLTDHKGAFIDSISIPGINASDWEDICGDDRGNLYIGDFGNNRNNRTDLHIIKYHPSTGRMGIIAFSYPDQKAFPPPSEEAVFDGEAFFWLNDSLHLFSKARLGTGVYKTRHYVLPAEPGEYVADLRDSFELKKRVVTAAAISDDGEEVAFLSYYFRIWLGFFPISRASVYVFSDFEGTRFFEGSHYRKRVPKFIAPTQYEAIDFYDEDHLVLGSEKSVLFHQKLRYMKLKHKKKAVP